MANPYHVYLDGKGYLLATGPDGRLLSGAVQTSKVDPFMHHVTAGDLYARQSFTFENGAGAAKVDGSGRYRSGRNIDTRGGNCILAPAVTVCQQETDLVRRVADGDGEDDLDTITISNAGGDVDGWAVRITIPAGKTQIKTAAVLIKRDRANDYAGANAFTVCIHQNNVDRPGVIIGTASPALDTHPSLNWQWVGEPWLSNRWFWCVCYMAATVTVTPGSTYWLSIMNAQPDPVLWAADSSGTYYRSEYDGATWTQEAQGGGPYYKLNFADEIDAPATCFHQYRGANDNILRMYAGAGRKVLYYDVPTETWAVSKGDFSDEVTDMVLFDNRLFVAQGPNFGLAHHDGTTATTVWTVLTNWQGQALALHDNLLWAAKNAELQASADGLNSGWGHGTVEVGDPGTIVTKLISHGGKLFALKEEGVFEITYPDDYPDTGEPAANMVHDFRTARAARAFALDWHSGLYFPGAVGVYEWRGGVLRDIWQSRIERQLDREAARGIDHLYYIETGLFQAAAGTTKGLWFAICSPSLRRTSIWYYSNQAWHPIYQDDVNKAEYIRGMGFESYGGGEGRLWFTAGHDIAYMDIHTGMDDRTLDDDATYQTQGEVELPLFDAGDPRILKHWIGVGVTSKHLDGSITIDVEYQLDADKAADTWTILGTVSSSPYEELCFFATASHSIRLKLTLNSPSGGGDPTDTPILEQVDLLYQPLPDTITTHQVTLRLADHLDNLDNVQDQRSAADLWTELAALLEKEAPFTYTDELGIDHTVRATGLTKQPAAVQDEEASPKIEGYAILQLLNISECEPGPA